MFPRILKLVRGNHTRTVRGSPGHPGNRHFKATFLVLTVLFITAEVADTLRMELSGGLSTTPADQTAIDHTGSVAYLSAYARICTGLAAWLLIVMTLSGIAVPLTVLAVIVLAFRSAGISLMASHPALHIPWFDHLADRAK